MRFIVKLHLIALAIVLSAFVLKNVSADELLLHIGSKHTGKVTTEYNERNYGIGYKRDHVRLGVYKNSYHKTSAYAAGDVHTQGKHLQIGIQGGIVSGYAGTAQGRGKLTPFALPYVAIGTNRVKAEVGYIPPVSGTGVVTFTLRVSI